MAELTKLDFDCKLLKSHSTKELLNSLEALHKELSGTEQGEVDLDSIREIAATLVSNRLVSHKDVGVKAYTSCCLSDILRLFAPDAPYTITELTLIFEFFIREFQNFVKPNNAYFKQNYFLLERIFQLQIIALVTDLPEQDSGKLIVQIFRLFYDILTKDQRRSKSSIGEGNITSLEYLLTSVLSQIIEEAPILPMAVIELIFSHLLTRSTKSKDSENSSLPIVFRGYNMSKNLCMDNEDVMIRNTNQYFSDLFNPMLMAEFKGRARKNDNEEMDDEDEVFELDSDDEVTGSDNLERTQQLIIEIWKTVPKLLTSVMGQLEQQLEVDNVEIRVMATGAIGAMLGHAPSKLNFVREHNDTFLSWIRRVRDKNSHVRLEWVNHLPMILINRPEDLPESLMQGYIGIFNDSDERVRSAACEVIGELDVETISIRFDETSTLWNCLSERLRDRRHQVRKSAFDVVGKLYNATFGKGQIGDKFSWIPGTVIDQLYINDKETNLLIDKTLFEFIFPRNFDDLQRTRRLLATVKMLGEHLDRFFFMAKRQVSLAKSWMTFITHCREYNGGKVVDKNNKKQQEAAKLKIHSIIKWTACQYPHDDKMTQALNWFVSRNDRYDYKLFTACMDPDSDYKTVQNSMDELLKRIRSAKDGRAFYESMFESVLYRASFVYCNKSNVTPMLAIVRTPGDELYEVSHEVLRENAALQPMLMKNQATELTNIIETVKPGSVNEGSVDTLKATNLLAQKFPDLVSQTSKFMNALVGFALNGNYLETKQAVKLLQHSNKRELYSNQVVQEILEAFYDQFDYESPKFSTRLAALAQLYFYIPEILEESFPDLLSPRLVKIILDPCPVTYGSGKVKRDEDDEELWREDDKIDQFCLQKILAIKVLVNRIRSCGERDESKQLARPVLKILITLLSNLGEIKSPNTATSLPEYYKSRLRFEAGNQVLKLAKSEYFNKLIRARDVYLLMSLVQDQCLQVRNRFINRLTKYLATDSLPKSRFLPLLFMTAVDPDGEIKSYVSTWIKSRHARQQSKALNNDTLFEQSFAMFLSMIAHHQELFNDESESDVIQSVKSATYCILYYLGLVASEGNISLIFYMAQRVKQYRDAIDDDDKSPGAVYLVSDLAQYVLVKYADIKGWNMVTWPGEISLSKTCFIDDLDNAEAQKIAKTDYFTGEYSEMVDSIIKDQLLSRHSSKKAQVKEEVKEVKEVTKDEIEAVEPSTPVKRNSPNNAGGAKKRAKLNKRKPEIDEEDRQTEDEDEDDIEMMEVEAPKKKSMSQRNRRRKEVDDEVLNDEDIEEENKPSTRTKRLSKRLAVEEHDQTEIVETPKKSSQPRKTGKTSRKSEPKASDSSIEEEIEKSKPKKSVTRANGKQKPESSFEISVKADDKEQASRRRSSRRKA